MVKLSVFNFITLNGCYKGAGGDLSWHRHGPEENEYAKEMSKLGNCLLFGSITYEHMKSYWPTAMAREQNPVMAAGMNNAEKIVFSNTLKKTDPVWENTTIINDDLVKAVKKLKQQSARDMTILGSGSIVSQLATTGLIDEYGFMLDPVAISEGTPVFKGINKNIDLQLVRTRTFSSGTILLTYQPL
jgi:dihydrofolate reductase